MLEQQGTPATVLITEPFQSVVASSAAKLGAPGYHSLVVPHPVWGKDEAALRDSGPARRRRGDRAADAGL